MEKAMKKVSLSTLVKISILGAISFLIMLLDFPLWFVPEFYKMDFSDLPGLIGAFTLGPVAGVLIELLKNILKFAFVGSGTGGVGEVANFIMGALYVGVAGLCYSKMKTRKGAILGMILGTVVMSLAGGLLNYYVLIPLYSKFMPIEQIIGMAKAINSIIVDLKSMIIYAVIPFNIFKGIVVSLVSIPLYKRLSGVLK